MADVAVHQFNNILLGGRGALTPGQLRVHTGGLAWRKLGGGKQVDVARTDMAALVWMRVPRGFQLCVRLKAGGKVKFNGFTQQDVAALSPFLTSTLGFAPKSKELATSGRNWGDADIDGTMLGFLVGGKQAFEISIADVSQTQLSGKNDVLLEFHVDDTATAAEDTLVEMSFHIPTTNTTYVGTEDKPSAQIFQEHILAKADVGPSGDESVVEFEGVHILTPRGRFKVELHVSHIRLQGMAVDFKIQYKNLARVFVLPKANQPHTFVVVTLDTPIRKGQTLYPHIVLQFPNEETFEGGLALSDELLTTKYKDRLQPVYKGLVHEVFAQILRGLSGSKVTRPGTFRSNSDGYAVRTSLKAEEGYLYPLEKSFFFLPKPPTLVLHDEVEYVEFERHGAGTSSISSSYFDLVIRLRNEQEHQFRNIQRNEYHNLFSFFSEKRIKILNLGDSHAAAGGGAEAGAGVVGVGVGHLESDDDAVDPHLNRIRAGGAEESDEEDEDFVAGQEDGGSPTESSEGSGSEGGSGSDSDSDASRAANEDEEETAKRKEKARKEKEREKAREEKAGKAASSGGAKRKSKEGGGGGGGEESGKKKRKKKDPDAPKRALSGFMYFSQSQRDQIKKDNPGIAFGDIGKLIGEKWKKMSAEEKAPYEDKAKVDKVRYADQMRSYKGGGGADDADQE
ncbi:hypothetical protein CLOM_g21338 [Closterium sp. NIES-68]|nr:hypothetical protein CLOM_g21338 [Closterium sp. NIES-68]GJP71921.1 hypothetical protein CLOP_g2709 [Closterium sp. NIES-67]